MVKSRFTQGLVALLSEVWTMLMVFEIVGVVEQAAFGCRGNEELVMKVSRSEKRPHSRSELTKD